MITSASDPVVVSGGRTFSAIAAGGASSCGIATSGMYCWGDLGWPTPRLISANNPYSRVAVGSTHACGHLTLGSYRIVDCWGANNFGQAGVHPWPGGPVPFTLGTGTGTNVAAVATEHEFTCVEQGNGTLQCFGTNFHGQLGNGRSGDSSAVAQVVGSGLQLNRVSTGTNHACALTPSNQAMCWGYGMEGQLGQGRFASSTRPVFVAAPVGVTFRAIAAGGKHTCAIGTNNLIYCWGANRFAQLGRGFVATGTEIVVATAPPT